MPFIAICPLILCQVDSKKPMMLFHDATLPGRLQRCTTYLLLLRNAKSGLWLPRPFFFGLYPLFAPSCVPYRSRTVESNVSQSSLSSSQGINRLRYPHNPSESSSTSFSFLILLNNLVSVVDANGSLRTAKRSVNTPCQPRYRRCENLLYLAYSNRMYANTLLYIPIPLGELYRIGIASCKIPLRLIFSKNAANKLKPPYAVIFLSVNSILTLFISTFVVHFDCIFVFSFRLELMVAKPVNSNTKGEFVLDIISGQLHFLS